MINTVSEMVELLELLKTKGAIPPPDQKKNQQKNQQNKNEYHTKIMTFLFYFI